MKVSSNKMPKRPAIPAKRPARLRRKLSRMPVDQSNAGGLLSVVFIGAAHHNVCSN